MMSNHILLSSQFGNHGSWNWYRDVFFTTDTLQSALLIILLVAACGLAIYNLPWTDAEIKASHTHTQTQLKRLLRLFSFSSSSAECTPQQTRHVGLDAWNRS